MLKQNQPADPAMKNKHLVAVRAALLALALPVALALNATTAIAQAPPGSLWYNGDFNYVNGLANERNTIVSQAAVYDDRPPGVACDGRLLR